MPVLWSYGPQGSWGKIVDDSEGVLNYVTHRKRHEHFHRLSASWGIDMAVLEDLEKYHVKKVVIVLDEEGEMLETTPLEFRLRGQVMTFPPYEPQMFLKEIKFRKRPLTQTHLAKYL